MFMYPPRSTSYYVVCLLDGRRVVLVQTQQHRETAALMKRKEEVCKHSTCLCLLQLKHGDIPVGVAKISPIGKHVAVRLASL